MSSKREVLVYTPKFHQGGKSRYINIGVSSRREVQVFIPRGFIKEGSPGIYTPGIYTPGFHQGGKSRYKYPRVLSKREVQVYIPRGFIEEGIPGIYTLGFYRGENCRYIIDCSITSNEQCICCNHDNFTDNASFR